MRRRDSAGATLALTLLAMTVLAGCAPWGESPEPNESVTATQEPEHDDTSAKSEFDPDGSAEDNLGLFTKVVEKVWKSDDNVHGRAYVDALVDKGFDKDEVQLTSDVTTIDWPAETIMFSVRVGDGCLVGQVGPDTGDPVTTVEPVLADGVCMLGNTRDIDW